MHREHTQPGEARHRTATRRISFQPLLLGHPFASASWQFCSAFVPHTQALMSVCGCAWVCSAGCACVSFCLFGFWRKFCACKSHGKFERNREREREATCNSLAVVSPSRCLPPLTDCHSFCCCSSFSLLVLGLSINIPPLKGFSFRSLATMRAAGHTHTHTHREQQLHHHQAGLLQMIAGTCLAQPRHASPRLGV